MLAFPQRFFIPNSRDVAAQRGQTLAGQEERPSQSYSRERLFVHIPSEVIEKLLQGSPFQEGGFWRGAEVSVHYVAAALDLLPLMGWEWGADI